MADKKMTKEEFIKLAKECGYNDERIEDLIECELGFEIKHGNYDVGYEIINLIKQDEY